MWRSNECQWHTLKKLVLDTTSVTGTSRESSGTRNLHVCQSILYKQVFFWYNFLARNWAQLYSITETDWHVTRTVQRDWPESCFGASNCDELASNFSCKFLAQVSWACVAGITENRSQALGHKLTVPRTFGNAINNWEAVCICLSTTHEEKAQLQNALTWEWYCEIDNVSYMSASYSTSSFPPYVTNDSSDQSIFKIHTDVPGIWITHPENV